MKKLVETKEVEGEGLEALMGETVTFFCLNYIYHGKLIGVNKTCVLISEPSIIYSTGAFTDKEWADKQSLECPEFYIQTATIESFGVMK
jgi:hypothetical protein